MSRIVSDIVRVVVFRTLVRTIIRIISDTVGIVFTEYLTKRIIIAVQESLSTIDAFIVLARFGFIMIGQSVSDGTRNVVIAGASTAAEVATVLLDKTVRVFIRSNSLTEAEYDQSGDLYGDNNDVNLYNRENTEESE